MKQISHRGNFNGPNPQEENRPTYIKKALEAGYDVEIDVWYLPQLDEYYLGHDGPTYKADLELLLDSRCICHAKNRKTLIKLLALGAHCFGNTQDHFVLTSKGYVWSWQRGLPITVYNKEGETIAICNDRFEK